MYVLGSLDELEATADGGDTDGEAFANFETTTDFIRKFLLDASVIINN